MNFGVTLRSLFDLNGVAMDAVTGIAHLIGRASASIRLCARCVSVTSQPGRYSWSPV